VDGLAAWAPLGSTVRNRDRLSRSRRTRRAGRYRASYELRRGPIFDGPYTTEPVRSAPLYDPQQSLGLLGQQKVSTSETQSDVQPKSGSQQLGSSVQTMAAQLLHVAHCAAPAVQMS